LDGEWEAPKIPNPEFKGEWRAKQIENPKYQGEWVHPQIDNPEFVPNPNLYAYDSFGGVGIEIWQVKSGTIFDNILITDSIEEAKADREEALSRIVGEKADEEADRKTREAEEDKKEVENTETDSTETDDNKEDL